MCFLCGMDVTAWLVDAACGTRPMMRRREHIIPRAEGAVLEIGAGGGRNFRFYDRTRVSSVLALDPSAEMIGRARRRAPADLPVAFLKAPAECADLPAASFDTIVSTFTVCTIPDPVAALAGLRPALRRGGRLLFCEHGLAPDPAVRRRQRVLEPVWRRLAGGCRLTRDIPAILDAAGWRLISLEQRYVRGAPRFAGYMSWGEAQVAEVRPPSRGT